MSYRFWWQLVSNCPKRVEFYSKNKFEKIVHLVGFIIRMYTFVHKDWDLRSCEMAVSWLHSLSQLWSVVLLMLPWARAQLLGGTVSLYSGLLDFTLFCVTQLSVVMGTWYSCQLKIKWTLFWIKHVKQAYTIRCSGMGIIMFEVCGVRINQSGVNEVWLLLSYYCHRYHIRYDCNFIV